MNVVFSQISKYLRPTSSAEELHSVLMYISLIKRPIHDITAPFLLRPYLYRDSARLSVHHLSSDRGQVVEREGPIVRETHLVYFVRLEVGGTIFSHVRQVLPHVRRHQQSSNTNNEEQSSKPKGGQGRGQSGRDVVIDSSAGRLV